MSVSYCGLVLFHLPALNESQRMGEEWELCLGGGVGKRGPAPNERQTVDFASDMVLGWGKGPSVPTPLPLS